MAITCQNEHPNGNFPSEMKHPGLVHQRRPVQLLDFHVARQSFAQSSMKNLLEPDSRLPVMLDGCSPRNYLMNPGSDGEDASYLHSTFVTQGDVGLGVDAQTQARLRGPWVDGGISSVATGMAFLLGWMGI